MQPNNKLRQFSGDTTNILSDSEYESEVVTQGAGKNQVANSALYNSLSKSTTGITTALADFIAAQNPSVEIGQDTNVNVLIDATNKTFASKKDLTSLENDISTNYISNSEFASETISKFNENIVPKKILVYDGVLKPTNSISITLKPTTTYQIIWNVDSSTSYRNKADSITFFRTTTANQQDDISLFKILASPTGDFTLQAGVLSYLSGTLTLRQGYSKQITSSGSNPSTTLSITVFKIYEIIE